MYEKDAAVTRYYPNSIDLAEFVEERSHRLMADGFRRNYALALNCPCRDEIVEPVREIVQARWGHAFDFSSLAGIPMAGSTALGAALSHVPERDGKQRLVAFAMPHIGVTEDGTLGMYQRRGQAFPTATCGSLAATLAWAQNNPGVDPSGEVDPFDPEQSIVRRRLIVAYPDLGSYDWQQLIAATAELQARDLWELIDRHTDADTVDLAMVTGILVHGPSGNWVEPGITRTRLSGEYHED